MVNSQWNETSSCNNIMAFQTYSDDDMETYEDEQYSKYFKASCNRNWNQEESNNAISSFFDDCESSDDEEIVLKSISKVRAPVAAATSTKGSGKEFGKLDHYNYKRGSFSSYQIGRSIMDTPAASTEVSFEASKPVKPNGLPSLATLAFQVATVFSVLMALQSFAMFMMNASYAMTMAKSVVFLVLSAGVVVPRAYANMLRDFQSKKSTSSTRSARVM